MQNFMTTLGLAVLLASAGNAAGIGKTGGNSDPDPIAGPVEAQNPVQVKASDVLTSKELANRGISGNTIITVSDFTAPGPRTTYER